MSNIVMPKNSVVDAEIKAVLKIYNEVAAPGWISSADYIPKLKALIGEGQYASSYPKKAQIPSYYGFVEWQDKKSNTSPRRITDRGRAFYSAWMANDSQTMHAILLDAMETTVFGRDNSGSPSSRSDVQAPCVCIRLILSLGEVYVNEFAYALWKLADKFEDYSDVVDEIKRNRTGLGKLDFAQLPNTYTDAKPISFLKNTGFIYASGNGALKINPEIEAAYMDRLKNLKIYGVDLNVGMVPGTRSQLLKLLPPDLAKYNPYLAAIRTKPFVLLAGISGTGKSRMVRQLARGCCPAGHELGKDAQGNVDAAKKPGNFEMIPVRPNWHDSTELMGYVTRLSEGNRPKYVLTPFVRFLVKAWQHKDVPFFLCLDEMNLAAVEQYFAEYLSTIETRKRVNGEITTDVLVDFSEDKVLDGVLEELSREIPAVMPAAQAPAMTEPAKKMRDKASLHKKWDDFLAEWPISRLRGITLEEYTKAGSVDTFTYALEARLSDLGSIWGGSAFKFGVYSRNPNGQMKTYAPNSELMGNSAYAWYRKFGSTHEAAWATVKERVVAIAEAASKGDFAAVDKIDIPHVVKWKIAFLYQNRNDIKIVDIFKKEWVVLLTPGLPSKTSYAERYLKLNEERKGMDVFEWDDTVLSPRREELLASEGDEDEDADEAESASVDLEYPPVLEMIRKDRGIRIPPNLVVIGTVNMDETTCSFSRKVLDRAMTFEFNEVEMNEGLSADSSIPYGAIPAGAATPTAVEAFEVYAQNKQICDDVVKKLGDINAILDNTPFKFAYRSRNEILIYCLERMKGDVDKLSHALDEAISMKILSRIEGDDQKLAYVGDDPDYQDETKFPTILEVLKDKIAKLLNDATCTVCDKKLDYMIKRLRGGFTNFFV